MSGLDDTLQTIKANRRTPTEQITRGALGIKAMMDLLLLRDFQNKFAIDAAEQKAAAKDRQPEMEDVELMTTDDEMRIGDEYHIHLGEQSPPATQAQQSQPSNVPNQAVTATKSSSTLGTMGTLIAGAALMGSGIGLAQVPSLMSSAQPATTQDGHPVTVPSPTDNDTIIDFSLSGGVDLEEE